MITTSDLSGTVADIAAARLEEAMTGRGCASIALTGGETPKAYLPALFRRPIDWSRITMTLADDRVVPVESSDSNEGLILGLMRGTPAASARWEPLLARRDDPAKAAAEASARLLSRIPWPLDLIILGIGEDGHIASLFPRLWHAGLDVATCLAVPTPPVPHRHPRVTLSLSALAASRNILIVLRGPEKRLAYAQAAANAESPLGSLLARAGSAATAVWAPE